MMVSFVLSFFPRDVLDEILNLIESVSEDFPSYSSNAKSALVSLVWIPQLCLGVVLYDLRFVNTFIIAIYGVMSYSLLMPNLVAFYAKLNKYKK